MECVYVTAVNKGGRRWSPQKPEDKKKKRRDEEGTERDRYGGRPRGQI